LTGAEVEVIEIVGDGLVEGRQLSIDQQMVMTGIRTIQPGGCNPHLLQTETDSHFRWNGRAIIEMYEINSRAFRRRRRTASSPFLRKCGAACDGTDDQQCRNKIEKPK